VIVVAVMMVPMMVVMPVMAAPAVIRHGRGGGERAHGQHAGGHGKRGDNPLELAGRRPDGTHGNLPISFSPPLDRTRELPASCRHD
jgi:hypothetical protein